jgi:hypothetical protein
MPAAVTVAADVLNVGEIAPPVVPVVPSTTSTVPSRMSRNQHQSGNLLLPHQESHNNSPLHLLPDPLAYGHLQDSTRP